MKTFKYGSPQKESVLTDKELDILLRRAKGETPSKIAHALKITRAAVSQFENNARRKLIEEERMREILKKNNITIIDSPAGKKLSYGGEK